MLLNALYMMLLLPAAATPGQDPSAAQAWSALFAQADPGKAATQIDAVVRACGNDVAKLRALIAADAAYEPFEPGWQQRVLPVTTPGRTDQVEFHLHVPAGYDAKAVKSWPLLLLAHGQGSNGRRFGREMAKLLGPAAENYILVSPTMPGEPLYSGRAYQEQAWLAPLGWARRSLHVDDDRIYLAGYSQGGHQTWHLATMFPYLWAAAVPMAGVPFFEGSPHVTSLYLPNLAPLPVWAIWGELDRAKPPALGNVDLCRQAAQQLAALKALLFTGTELPGAGHHDCWPKGDELAAYLDRHKRTLAPPAFTHAFHAAAHRRAYYLEALEFVHPPMDIAKGVRVTVEGTGPPTQQQMKNAFLATFERGLFKLTATLEPASNTLNIRAPGVRKVRLYVYDGMLDLSRPVTIRFWTATWKGVIAPSARCLLTHYAATRDATGLILREVDLDSSGQALLR